MGQRRLDSGRTRSATVARRVTELGKHVPNNVSECSMEPAEYFSPPRNVAFGGPFQYRSIVDVSQKLRLIGMPMCRLATYGYSRFVLLIAHERSPVGRCAEVWKLYG